MSGRDPTPEEIKGAEEMLARGKMRMAFVTRSDWLAGQVYDLEDVPEGILRMAGPQMREELGSMPTNLVTTRRGRQVSGSRRTTAS